MKIQQLVQNNRNPYRLIRKILWRLSMLGLPRGAHITRYAMYQRLREVGHVIPYRMGRVLSISHSGVLGELMGIQATDLVNAAYPEHNMLSLSFADHSFDFVLSNQVLEHLEGDPFDAIKECGRVLVPGGLAIHTTCFINPVHGSPSDFWRYTPDALRLLHQGWDVIECDGWGNLYAWTSIVADGLRWEGVPNARWHPMHKIATKNDPEWPITTWIVARKLP